MSLESAVIDVLNRSLLPATAAVLGRLTKPLVGKGFKKAFLTETLAAMTAAEQIRAVSLSPRKPSELSYTTFSLPEITAQILRNKVHSASKPIKEGELRKKLPPTLDPFFDEAFQTLLSRREVFVAPKVGRPVFKQAPQPSDLVDPAKRKAISGLLTQVNPLRQTPLTINDFLHWLNAEEPNISSQENAPETPIKGTAMPTEDLLRQWYAYDRMRSSTQMIPIPKTWRRYVEWAHEEGGQPEMDVFKSLLENLYNAGKVLLEPCEHPQDLPEEERSLLVPLAIGPPGFAWSWM